LQINKNINFINFDFLNNKQLLNNKLFFSNQFLSIFKYILKYYLIYYKKINNNKILSIRKTNNKYNKKYIHRVSSVVTILKKSNYFSKIYFNIYHFKKVYNKFKMTAYRYKKYNNYKYYGIVNINTCINNTYITLTNLKGEVISTLCGGLLKIKGPKRATSVASEAISNKIKQVIIQKNIKFIILKLNGILHSRKMKAAVKSIYSNKY
jgi:ribosomal protein S11